MSEPYPDLLYRVAHRLLIAPVRTAPAEALALIGSTFDADRAWLIRLDEPLQNFWVAYEWCADGVPACLPDLPCVPTTLIAHPLRDFLQDKSVVIADIEKLPPDAQALKEEMRREGNRATAGVPLWREGKLVALIGLDDVRKIHPWPKAEMACLRSLGQLVLAAADRHPDALETPAAARSTHLDSGGCYLRAGNCHVQVHWDEVVSISAEGDHSRVRLAGGREFFELKALSVWMATLPADQFVRVHRSHIVNWSHVERVRRASGGRWTIELKEGRSVPVGRSCQDDVRTRLNLRRVRRGADRAGPR